ncbi:hypothetical protein Sjap_002243 [Stephania japonica]|uniref:Uncharacterized protein n=1 Tax=Stephania japonica TaxID=461633 RepID=A0AAP0PSC8_9MAGN
MRLHAFIALVMMSHNEVFAPLLIVETKLSYPIRAPHNSKVTSRADRGIFQTWERDLRCVKPLRMLHIIHGLSHLIGIVFTCVC